MANPVRGPLGRHSKAGGDCGYFWGLLYKVNKQLEWFAKQPLNSPDQIEKEGQVSADLQEDKAKLARKQFKNNGKVDFDFIYQVLEPDCTEGQDYCICRCPKCGQRRPYFYKDKGQIICNRINSCGYEVSLNSLNKLLDKKRSA